MRQALFEIVDNPILVEEVTNKVARREAGAITTFIGTVRELTKGKRTLHLEYEAYKPMAVKQLMRIGEEISERWPDAKVAITHRVGRLEIMDIAVVIAVSSPHRKVAYEANEYAIERIKRIVPIWKKRIFGKMERCGLEINLKTHHIQKENQRRKNEKMITILLFANLREEVGSDRLVISEKQEMTVQQLKEWLKVSYCLQSLDKVMVAVNEELVMNEEMIKAGDIVALIPPVSGG